MLVGRRGSPNLILVNDGAGHFSDESGFRIPADIDPTMAVVPVDVNKDNAPDLFVANDGKPDRLYINNGLGFFSDETGTRLPGAVFSTLYALVKDMDSDGDPDLLLATGKDGVQILINDAAGIFTNETASLLPAQTDFTIHVQAGDIDYDGDVDIIAANSGQDTVFFFDDAAASFIAGPGGFLPANQDRSFGLALFDADNDFDLDLAIAVPGGRNKFLVNTIDFPRIKASFSPSYIEVGDTIDFTVDAFDEDGITDTSLTIIQPDASEVAVTVAGGSAAFIPTQSGLHTAVFKALDTQATLGSWGLPFEVLEADTSDPVVSIDITGPSPLLLGHDVTITVTTSDDRSVISTSLTVNGVNLPLDVNGRAVYRTAAIGLHTVEASAMDAAGNTGNAVETVTIFADTIPPVISLSAGPDPVDLTFPVSIHATATDNVRVKSLNVTVTGPGDPAGIDIPLDGSGNGTYTPYLPGTYTVAAVAVDPTGTAATETVTVEAVGVPDTTPPEITLTITPHTVALGDSVTITVAAVDNVTVTAVSLEINGTPVILDPSGSATYTPPVLGPYTAIARAVDPSGNESEKTDTFRAADPAGDTQAPLVSIAGPVDDQEVTDITDITGTVTDLTLVQYTLSYAPVGSSDYTIFASGDREKENDILGSLDPTLLNNGFYDIRLWAEDLNGRTSTANVVVSITGDLKLGQFAVSYKDKALNIGRFPLDVTRAYDSRNRSVKGDFGYGWSISLSDVELIENRSPGQSWSMQSAGGFFPTYYLTPTRPHTVTVKFAEDSEEKFMAEPNPKQQVLYPIQWLNGMNYVPIGEAKGTLIAHESPDIFIGGEILGFDLNIYNPSAFTYEAEDGYSYVFTEDGYDSLRHKLTAITDPSGTRIDLTAGGFVRSDGLSLSFTRDSEGRITRITDPMGYDVTYTYDASGDLVGVTDAENNTVTFVYDANHYLLEIRDPLNRPAQKNEYDDNGRLIAITDGNGERIEMEYDIDANTQIIRDRRGNPTIYEYDGHGNVIQQTEFPEVDGTVAQVETFREYDTDSQLISEINPNSMETTFTYSTKGELLGRIIDVGGLNLTEELTYDIAGRVLTNKDPRGNQVINTYDTNGNLTSLTARDGSVTSHEYNGKGLVIKTTDALGNYTLYEYDTLGNMTAENAYALGDDAEFDPPLRRMEYTYNPNGLKLTETVIVTKDVGGTPTPTSATTTYTYDNNGRLLTETDPMGNEWKTEYDPLGNRTATVDPLGNRTEYTFNPRSEVIRIDYPDGTFVEYGYDADGNRISEKDRNGNTTTFAYDALDRITRIQFADDVIRKKYYDPAGNLIGEEDELGNRTDHEYDAVGRRIRTIQPSVYNALTGLDSRPVTTYEYDENRNKTSMTDANGHQTTYSYDEENRLLETTYPDTLTGSSSVYDPVGNEISKTDPEGLTTLFTYDALRRLIETRLPVPQSGGTRPVTAYQYDEAGNLVSQTDVNGHITVFEYDLAGRKTARVLPGGQRETFTSDGANRLIEHVDFNGETTTRSYNQVGRETLVTYDDGTSVATTYGGEGQRLTVTDSRGETAYTYDLRNRLLSVTSPDGTVVSYTYNDASKQAGVNSPAGTVAYEYDELLRLSTVTAANGDVTSYEYDPVGNLISEIKPNGTVTSYAYNSRNQLVSLTTTTSGGTVIDAYAYVLNKNGLRTKVTEYDGSTVDYTYDDNYRLVQEVRTGTQPYNIQYTYDPVGNRTEIDRNGIIEAYTYDVNDRLLTEGTINYFYDNNGNLITKLDGATLLTEYSYDGAGRLVESIDATLGITSYTYDADGNRVQREHASGTVNYVVDSYSNTGISQVLEERDDTNALMAYYTFGQDLISQERGTAVSYYHRDGLGSTRALTDTHEVVTDTYIFDGYGNKLSSTGSTVNTSLFAGEHFDPNVGFYYLRARYYDQNTGRFITMDPLDGDLQSPPSLHRYLYANNNPVNFTDPTGKFTLVEVNVSLSIQSTIRSIHTKNLLKFFFKAAKIAFCQLEPAYKMQALGLDMIARNLPGGELLVMQAREQIAKAFQAIGSEIASMYKDMANDIFKVEVEVGGALKDLYDMYTTGSVPVPVPSEVAKLLEFKEQLEGWMETFGRVCRAVDVLTTGTACEKFTLLADNADTITDLIPDF